MYLFDQIKSFSIVFKYHCSDDISENKYLRLILQSNKHMFFALPETAEAIHFCLFLCNK